MIKRSKSREVSPNYVPESKAHSNKMRLSKNLSQLPKTKSPVKLVSNLDLAPAFIPEKSVGKGTPEHSIQYFQPTVTDLPPPNYINDEHTLQLLNISSTVNGRNFGDQHTSKKRRVVRDKSMLTNFADPIMQISRDVGFLKYYQK